MGEKTQEWTKFFDRCVLGRVEGAKFSAFSKALYSRNPIVSSELADIFLRPRSKSRYTIDPLIPIYFECLLSLELINVPDALEVLLRYSRSHQADDPIGSKESGSHGNRQVNSADLEEILIYRLAKCFTTGNRPTSPKEAYDTLKAVAAWMSAIIAASTKDEMMQDLAGVGTSTQIEAVAICEAIGTLVLTMAENVRMTSALGGHCPKDVKQTFTHSLSMYISFLSPMSLQTAHRLASFAKEYIIHDNDTFKAISDNMMAGMDVTGLSQLQGVDGVLEGQHINSRAGLYIYFSALLVGPPVIDDNMVLAYLFRRYQGDISALTIDLITIPFDLLSNAMYRNEPPQILMLLRSFLINKIPVMLATISSSMFPPLTPEYCITVALSHVDPNVFPSSVLDRAQFHDVRPEFILACALHHLIPEESIVQLLNGEDPMQPVGGMYVKDELVQQCTMDQERLEALLEEIENMDGNAGAIVGALTEIIRNLCNTKETMSLKTICSSLSRKPSSLDVILLFTSPSTLLLPVCQLLNNWKFEEDQGEYQPVYEDFGGILLLVLAFVQRYELSVSDLGLNNDESFIAQLLTKGSLSRLIEDLSEEQNAHLGGWIRGLFEAGHISDDLMSSCPPQDFYLLVPILFSQSVTACKANILDVETLKGGLEYFLQTFLLPSLVSAITWITIQIWECSPSISILLQILQTLIKPASISGEAQAMHHTIVSLIAAPLESSLLSARRRGLQHDDMEPILQALQRYQTFKRTAASPYTELEAWTATQRGGLLASIRNTFQSLVLWSAAPEINLTPPSYTHRQLLVAVKLLGAKRVLGALVDEIKLQTENGSAELALDIGTSLICAPSTIAAAAAGGAGGDARMSLKEALKMEVDLLRKEGLGAGSEHERAETVVRLGRRVAAETLAESRGRQQQVVNELIGDLDVAAAAAVADGAAAADGGGGGGGAGQSGGAEDLYGISGVGVGGAVDELEELGILDVGDVDGGLFGD